MAQVSAFCRTHTFPSSHSWIAAREKKWHLHGKDQHWSCRLLISGELVFFFCLFVLFFVFQGHIYGIWRFPGYGSDRSCHSWPTPQSQEPQIWAMSAPCTTAHGNARSWTHWVRPGIEPTTSWFLVGFINHSATTGTPRCGFDVWLCGLTFQGDA